MEQKLKKKRLEATNELLRNVYNAITMKGINLEVCTQALNRLDYFDHKYGDDDKKFQFLYFLLCVPDEA